MTPFIYAVLLRTRDRIVLGHNAIALTRNGIVETRDRIVLGRNGIVLGCNGIASTRNGTVESAEGNQYP